MDSMLLTAGIVTWAVRQVSAFFKAVDDEDDFGHVPI